MKTKLTGIITALLMACSSVSVYAETEMDDEVQIDASSIGDVNNDSVFSDLDIRSMSSYLLNNEMICEENADLNLDSQVNIVDFIMLKDNYMTAVYDKVSDDTIVQLNDGSYKDMTIEYKYLDETYTADFDSLEQQVFVKLNDFRERYGLQRTPVFYRGIAACDEAAAAGGDEVFNVLGNHFIYRMSLYNTINSTDPDTIVNNLLLRPRNKGALLTPDYYVSVGHSGSLWVMLVSWVC